MLEHFNKMCGGAGASNGIIFGIVVLIFVIIVIAGGIAGVLSVQDTATQNQSK